MAGRGLEQPYSSFKILDLTKKAGQEKLHHLLVPLVQKGTASESVFDDALGLAGRAAPLALAAIVESAYVDRDHARAHDAFFTRAFIQLPRKSTRVHFFTQRLNRGALRRLDDYRDSYLGYTVVRPLRVRRVGRTVIRPVIDPGETIYITASRENQVHVAGIELSIAGPPFMEQDERVSRCATAALWMANSAIADRVGLPHFSTAEITQFATRYVGFERAIPSGGLVTEQMAEALRAMGYDSIRPGFSLTDPDDVWSFLYAYVESGIPPMLVLNLGATAHVVTAIGHSWQPLASTPRQFDVAWINEPALKFHRSMSWVPQLVAHDDESGPFVRVAPMPRASFDPAFPHLAPLRGIPVIVQKQLRDKGIWQRYPAILQQVLIPNPPGVTLNYREAEVKAARTIKAWFAVFSPGVAPPDDYVLRTYLTTSNELKESIRGSGMHPKARDVYSGKGMPRWVWITEISQEAWVNNPDPSHQLIRGEVVIDATSSPWTADFISFHLVEGDDGYLSTMLPSDSDAEAAMSSRWRLVGEQPYEHLCKHVLG